MLREIIIILIFYFLILLQSSFLIHFNFFNFLPNLVLIFLVFLNFFRKTNDFPDLIIAFTAGFLLDIFSNRFIGFYVLICLAIYYFIKFLVKKYIYLERAF